MMEAGIHPLGAAHLRETCVLVTGDSAGPRAAGPQPLYACGAPALSRLLMFFLRIIVYPFKLEMGQYRHALASPSSSSVS